MNAVPAFVFELSGALHSLALGGNAIQQVGRAAHERWSSLNGLSFIDLSNCRLEDLGSMPVVAAKHLKLLRSLDLSNNDLRQIPAGQ